MHLQNLASLCLCHRFPEEEDLQLVQQTFFDIGHILGVVGCIDGTHVRIFAPVEHADQYNNRGNSQSACASDMRL